MANKHLPNRELEILNSTTDFFGHIEKGNAIASFLTSNVNNLNQTNMIALYGKWGSGKSTLMKYIGTELEKSDYKSLYFPAWEFEKDENLPLSLLHFISDKTGTDKIGVVKEFLDLAGDASLSALKAITIDAGILKINPKVILDSADAYVEKNKEKSKSAYNNTKELKKKFAAAEKAIIKKLKKQKLVVFIDDLDRCEPENVLNLISAIKLFFTYSSEVIFMFGCDKDAISKAVKHKYGDIIKSDEYLEKVIDVSFNMPSDISINLLLQQYFPERIVSNEQEICVSEYIEDFFQTINFINPRELKKVLNKFEILKSFEVLPKPQSKLIPRININSEQDILMVEFVLLFIILHEFFNETFIELLRFSQKKVNYTDILRDAMITANAQKSVSFNQANMALHANCKILNSLDHSFKEIVDLINKNLGSNESLLLFNYFLTIFTPILYSDKFAPTDSGRAFISQFYHKNNSKGDIVSLKFCEYLFQKRDVLLNLKSEYKVADFFRMCQILL